MPTEPLVESTWSSPLPLSEREAQALRALGQRLAGSRGWWGSDNTHPDDEDIPQRSVIECAHVEGGYWRMRVRDAVGVVAVGARTFQVQPKIPVPHYLYLLERAQVVPRRDSQRVGVKQGESLWSLVARWFLVALGDVVKSDLIRDYREVRETLSLVRGRVRAITTTRDFYKGRIALDCKFEEFDVDNPLNRVLKAATRAIVASPLLDRAIRRDAIRLQVRLGDVGDLRRGDLNAMTDLRTHYYADAIELARHVLAHQGRTLHVGEAPAWSFLLRSPEAIEAGIRAVLEQGVADITTVTKQRRMLPPSRWSLNPDLVFAGGRGVGDVKYTLTSGEWVRSQLYQATTFATGYQTLYAVVVGFRPPSVNVPKEVRVGNVKVTYIAWCADHRLGPAQAAEALIADCRDWLSSP